MFKHKGRTTLIIILLIFSMILFYGYAIEPKSMTLHVSSPKISQLPSDWQYVKIVYFSDLTLTEESGVDTLKKTIQEISEQKPDLLLYSGNVFDAKNTNDLNDGQITELLSKLEAPLGKFALTAYSPENIDNITRAQSILSGAQFNIVDNTSRKIYNHSLDALQLISINEAASENDINNLLQTSQDTSSLLLTTKPSIYSELMNHPNVHLTLASGSYGGLVNLPFLNQVFVKDYESDYTKGYYYKNTSQLLLMNGGIGTPSYFPIRLFNRPSFYVLSLQKTDEEKTDKEKANQTTTNHESVDIAPEEENTPTPENEENGDVSNEEHDVENETPSEDENTDE